MATYKSEEVTLQAPASTVFEKLNNLEGLGAMIQNAPVDMIPADKRELLGQIRVTADTISFPAGAMGSLTLRKVESVAPRLIRLQGEGSPVPMSMTLHISPMGEECSTAEVEIDLKVPAMLKPMLNGPMQKMTREFAQMLRSVKF